METYTYPNLPRKAGAYRTTCPTCGKTVITFRVSKSVSYTGTRWAFRAATCRKCGTMMSGLLPR